MGFRVIWPKSAPAVGVRGARPHKASDRQLIARYGEAAKRLGARLQPYSSRRTTTRGGRTIMLRAVLTMSSCCPPPSASRVRAPSASGSDARRRARIGRFPAHAAADGRSLGAAAGTRRRNRRVRRLLLAADHLRGCSLTYAARCCTTRAFGRMYRRRIRARACLAVALIGHRHSLQHKGQLPSRRTACRAARGEKLRDRLLLADEASVLVGRIVGSGEAAAACCPKREPPTN
jgi:hypothetical protein